MVRPVRVGTLTSVGLLMLKKIQMPSIVAAAAPKIAISIQRNRGISDGSRRDFCFEVFAGISFRGAVLGIDSTVGGALSGVIGQVTVLPNRRASWSTRRSLRRAPAVAYLPAGSFERAFFTNSSSTAGTEGLYILTLGTVPVACLRAMLMGVSALYGRRPVRSSYSSTPAAYTSLAGLGGAPALISGARYGAWMGSMIGAAV